MQHPHPSFFVRLFIAIPLFAAMILFPGLGCKGTDKNLAERVKPITLKYWRVFDDSDVFTDAITAYRLKHSNITIDYRKFRFEEYEKALLDALAEDKGPDIISLHNTWIGRWEPRLLPVPATLSLAYKQVASKSGGLKQEELISEGTVPGMTLKQLANDFVDVVPGDVTVLAEQEDPRAPLLQQIYGLPLFTDTLVMFYNRDILNNAGIAEPALTWDEFQTHVKKITKLDQLGTILLSGAAIGTAKNVERSSDILSLLMMQNGAQMTDSSGKATFDQFTTDSAARQSPPGAEALVFYTDFANPEKEVYAWNDKMPNSLEAFTKGQVAYFFGYSYHLPAIRSANSKLNFGIANFPHIKDNTPIYYANYWVETVSKKTKYPNEAWDFVQTITKADQAQKYLARAKRPTALRSLINTQLEDADLSVFAAQVPYAKSWYHGTDAVATENIFQEMITSALAADANVKKILETGAVKVNQTVK